MSIEKCRASRYIGASRISCDSSSERPSAFQPHPLAAIMKSNSLRTLEPLFPIPQTQSAFHPRAQRSAFRRRDGRPQRRTFSRKNPRLPDSHPNLFGLSAACYCFFSGSTLGNFLPGSNSPANAFTKAFRKALPIVVNISGRGCSNVPENGTLVPNRSFE